MPGEWITDRQCRRYMERRRSGDTQAVAAARAGISERSGRRLTASAQLPSQSRKRRGRTRLDPLADLWDEIVVPMLRQVPMLRATTVMEEIGRDHPGRLDERHLRTLQRRIAHWRATEGPEREIIFRQEHPPGYQSLCDFTEPAGVEDEALACRPRPGTSRRAVMGRATPPRWRAGPDADRRAHDLESGRRPGRQPARRLWR